ncbi:hypothetical protein NIES22_00530 [Calothrix brevissima NIES-22]|nr:hypothetical protein NIES22_00530 [Calothrix brevissima NIES-22]
MNRVSTVVLSASLPMCESNNLLNSGLTQVLRICTSFMFNRQHSRQMSYRLRSSASSQSMPELENCYSGVRQDSHHSIQHISCRCVEPMVLALRHRCHFSFSQNYLTISLCITIKLLIFLYLCLCVKAHINGALGMGHWATVNRQPSTVNPSICRT